MDEDQLTMKIWNWWNNDSVSICYFPKRTSHTKSWYIWNIWIFMNFIQSHATIKQQPSHFTINVIHKQEIHTRKLHQCNHNGQWITIKPPYSFWNEISSIWEVIVQCICWVLKQIILKRKESIESKCLWCSLST